MRKSPRPVYAVLLLAWGLVLAWQIAEHVRFKRYARTTLLNRTHDITTTLELVIRSQRRFGWNLVSQDRLESALNELVRSGEVRALALLNATGEVVASAGQPVDLQKVDKLRNNEYWGESMVLVSSLVDLGTVPTRDGETNRPTIVLPRGESGPRPPWEDRDRSRPRPDRSTNEMAAQETNEAGAMVKTNVPGSEDGGRGREGDRPPWRRSPGPRMDPQELQSLIERRGLHGLVIGMSVEPYHKAAEQDAWTRMIICSLATIAAGGVGFAWKNQSQTSELQMRLLKASEQNAHLQELNLAAAGLAHETRNPLNIIRGLAHLVRDRKDVSPEVERKCQDIIAETDRVTSQLNEFINYSRPREVRMARVDLAAVVTDVVRTLGYDIEEKELVLSNQVPGALIQADEQMLRQMIFNLLLNAIQAVDPGGQITLNLRKENGHGYLFEICDNGPGVAPEHREQIFKPYFTTHQKGTGLGLSVVQQIVSAHGWEITLLPNNSRGAIFRISHLRPDQNG